MSKEDEEFSDRDMTILDYIRHHPGTTKSGVVEGMDKAGKSSRVPTLNSIENLFKKKLINIEKKKPNSQTHPLFVNDQDDFNIVDQALTGIKNIMESFDKPLMHIEKVLLRHPGSTPPYPYDRYSTFRFIYKEAVMIMLQVLMFRIATRITTKDKSQILYSKITELIQKLTLQSIVTSKLEKILLLLMKDHTIKELREFATIRGEEDKIISRSVMNQMVATIERLIEISNDE